MSTSAPDQPRRLGMGVTRFTDAPSLSTSCSHKYSMLFADYNVALGVVDMRLGDSHLAIKLEIITDSDHRLQLSTKLLEKSADLKQQSIEMWAEVFGTVAPRITGPNVAPIIANTRK